MSRFRQAAPDPDKAARDGVSNYVPARRQHDLSRRCELECGRAATWEITLDGKTFDACHDHRRELVLSPGTYQEKKL